MIDRVKFEGIVPCKAPAGQGLTALDVLRAEAESRARIGAKRMYSEPVIEQIGELRIQTGSTYVEM
ncbi:MAG TPA: hypothetical protein VIO60_00240 [Rectinemataceae bacterium]